MIDDRFTIEAHIDSFFGSSVGTISVELTPLGTAVLSQDGVQITVAASQLEILRERLTNHLKAIASKK